MKSVALMPVSLIMEAIVALAVGGSGAGDLCEDDPDPTPIPTPAPILPIAAAIPAIVQPDKPDAAASPGVCTPVVSGKRFFFTVLPPHMILMYSGATSKTLQTEPPFLTLPLLWKLVPDNFVKNYVVLAKTFSTLG